MLQVICLITEVSTNVIYSIWKNYILKKKFYNETFYNLFWISAFFMMSMVTAKAERFWPNDSDKSLHINRYILFNFTKFHTWRFPNFFPLEITKNLIRGNTFCFVGTVRYSRRVDFIVFCCLVPNFMSIDIRIFWYLT